MKQNLTFFILFATALPLSVRAAANVKFYLYTDKNPFKPQQLFVNDENSVKKSNFATNLHTKIIIHGWRSSYTTTPNEEIRRAYLSKDKYNIISVDWNSFAKLIYPMAITKIPDVGKDIAEFIDFLNKKFNLRFEKLVIIGHSLGAHVAGFTGKNVKSGKLEAIVGLDPAQPCYSFENKTTRLNSGDAKYVQTIHTNGYYKGFKKPVGSASFYPNWGLEQPGCGPDLKYECAHSRCVAYYADAVRGYSFAPVYKCVNYDNIAGKKGCDKIDLKAEIGDPFEIQRVDGIFYFKTNDKEPFGHSGDRKIHNGRKA